MLDDVQLAKKPAHTISVGGMQFRASDIDHSQDFFSVYAINWTH
jgi:hypothetical protein